MSTPSYEITIGAVTIVTGAISITVDAQLGIPSDTCEISFPSIAYAVANGIGTPLTVKLGYKETGVYQVFTGTIDKIRMTLTTVVVSALGFGWRLAGIYLNKTFEPQSSRSIVGRLCDEAGIIFKDRGTELPSDLTFKVPYVVDDKRSLYENVEELAKKVNYDYYVNHQGELVYQPYQPPTDANQICTFSFGTNVIEAEQSRLFRQNYIVRVYGESPSPTKGEGSLSWIANDPGLRVQTQRQVAGTIPGSPPRKIIVSDPMIRDTVSADVVVDACAARLSKDYTGLITVLGEPRARLAGTVELQNMPEASMNDRFKITRVFHRFEKKTGFVTMIDVER
ncbi:MAG: hypothetical protein QCH35_11275 [Methanomicrobiaceae archaeon]|nr:hypothetical protein [Methanomicrobiaceae archaeon]